MSNLLPDLSCHHPADWWEPRLTAFLQEETAALSSLKRRIFREALSMRMQAMGELGGVMEESAREAIELLSHLGGDELGTYLPWSSTT